MGKASYSRYQVETSPRKIQPEYNKPKNKNNNSNIKPKSTINKNIKSNTKNNTKIVLCIIALFSVFFSITYRNALIAQNYSEIKELKSEYAELGKENKQLEVNIESKTNITSIEQKAIERLGLKKLDKSQTVYVSLDKQDYIESSKEEVKIQNNSFIYNIINKIKNIF